MQKGNSYSLCHSVTQSCSTLCNPMNCITPSIPVPHLLLKFAQVHVLCIGDAIQPSHPLMPSYPLPSIFPTIRDFSNESTVHIKWPKYWSFSSFQRVFSVDVPYDWLVWSPCCPRNFQESSPAPQFEGINLLTFCLLYGPALTTKRDHWENHSLEYTNFCQQSNFCAFQHSV